MLYFTLKLSEEYEYSYEIDKISDNIKDFNTQDTIFYSDEELYEGDVIDFYELSDFDIYSGYVYKILDSDKNIATVICYDDIHEIYDYIQETENIIIRIDRLFYKKKTLVDIFELTSRILCDICEVDIPKYS